MGIPMNYVALDIETTGLNPRYDKIIEIGAVRVRDGKAEDTFSSFVNPAKSLPTRIIELTGIQDADVCKAPYIDEVLDAFLTFAGDDVLLGHNLIFDYSFVKKAAVNCKKSYERTGIDTLKIAKCFLGDLESRSLGFLCEYFQIALDAHRALNDAIAAHTLYQILAQKYGNVETKPFQPRQLVYNVRKENPITPKQLELLLKLIVQYHLQREGYLLSPVVNVTEDTIDLQKLSKNEASRLIDKLLSNFRRSYPLR
ncbi:MAG: 3'-5' exonuclease [Lachnospiraceae bacterium]|jgi:DNA polymerase-3 subunit alpha (Gram-positive type)|nr:3'-5' exonuclease [Lachnospiraceae bacterium]